MSPLVVGCCSSCDPRLCGGLCQTHQHQRSLQGHNGTSTPAAICTTTFVCTNTQAAGSGRPKVVCVVHVCCVPTMHWGLSLLPHLLVPDITCWSDRPIGNYTWLNFNVQHFSTRPTSQVKPHARSRINFLCRANWMACIQENHRSAKALRIVYGSTCDISLSLTQKCAVHCRKTP